MEAWAEDQLTRRERRRAERELEHSAPARIRLKFTGVVVIVVALLTWLAVSWLSSATPAGEPVPEPPPLQGAAQTGGEAVGTPGAAEGPGQAEGPGPPNSSGAPAAPGTSGAQQGAEESIPVVVHVGGAVAEPGVVELPSGARVHEAIEAAGGMTSKADPGGLNLAAPIQDGTLIWVPTPEELEIDTGPPSAGQNAAGPPAAEQGGAGTAPGSVEGSASGAGAGDLINLNTADSATLEALPGIGPALSERIITHRETNGPFGSLEELAGVRGIGPVILGDVEGLVTW